MRFILKLGFFIYFACFAIGVFFFAHAQSPSETSDAACQQGRRDDRVEQCKISAREGSGDAAYVLARASRFGRYGVPVNQKSATEWYELAAKRAGGIAYTQLGIRSLCGIGASRDLHAARNWFQAGADSGVISALSWAGLVWMDGIGGRKDLEISKSIFLKGAEYGDVSALMRVGLDLASEQDSRESVRAKDLFRQAETKALNSSVLGVGIYQELGSIAASAEDRSSPAQEARLFEDDETRAKLGSVDAAFALGQRFLMGLRPGGVDREEAFHWFRFAANQGHAGAQFNLAQMFMRGWGTNKDIGAGVKLLERSVQQGDMRAHFALGWLKLKGIGGPQDKSSGFALIKIAAEHGNEDAVIMASILHAQGVGGRVDLAESDRWWRERFSCAIAGK